MRWIKDTTSAKIRLQSASSHGAFNMKKIAFITTSSSSVLNFRAELIDALLDRSAEIHVIAPDFDERTKSRLLDMSITPHECQFSRTGLNPFDNIFGIVRMFRVLWL